MTLILLTGPLHLNSVVFLSSGETHSMNRINLNSVEYFDVFLRIY